MAGEKISNKKELNPNSQQQGAYSPNSFKIDKGQKQEQNINVQEEVMGGVSGAGKAFKEEAGRPNARPRSSAGTKESVRIGGARPNVERGRVEQFVDPIPTAPSKPKSKTGLKVLAFIAAGVVVVGGIVAAIQLTKKSNVNGPVHNIQTPDNPNNPNNPDPNNPNNPDNPDPNNPDPNNPDPNNPDPEEHTEAEYKVMCEQKLANLISDYAENKNYTITDIEITTVNKSKGIYYAVGEVENVKYFITASFKNDSKLIGTSSYKDLYDLPLSVEDLSKVGTQEMLSEQVTPESYKAFLDMVVNDDGFKQALNQKGITLPSGIYECEDVSSVVNAYIINNKTIGLIFVDLNNSKTIDRVEVRANVPITIMTQQEMVEFMNNPANLKSYTITKDPIDYSTYNSVMAELMANASVANQPFSFDLP
jgi:hypothetical protein